MRSASLRVHRNLPATFRTRCQIAACCGGQKSFCANMREHIWLQLWAKTGLGLDLLAALYEKA